MVYAGGRVAQWETQPMRGHSEGIQGHNLKAPEFYLIILPKESIKVRQKECILDNTGYWRCWSSKGVSLYSLTQGNESWGRGRESQAPYQLIHKLQERAARSVPCTWRRGCRCFEPAWDHRGKGAKEWPRTAGLPREVLSLVARNFKWKSSPSLLLTLKAKETKGPNPVPAELEKVYWLHFTIKRVLNMILRIT